MGQEVMADWEAIITKTITPNKFELELDLKKKKIIVNHRKIFRTWIRGYSWTTETTERFDSAIFHDLVRTQRRELFFVAACLQNQLPQQTTTTNSLWLVSSLWWRICCKGIYKKKANCSDRFKFWQPYQIAVTQTSVVWLCDSGFCQARQRFGPCLRSAHQRMAHQRLSEFR